MTDGFTRTAQAQQRVIRVFVSSTFRDMQAERDHLVKFIFPQLRKLCEARGVTWGEVDLRWGITEEQSERGEIVSYCLEEIDRCRPYFIGLLGDYYGTLARKVVPDLKPKEGWPEDSAERSVTELEIVHGVLANPQMADHAFFYFRDPAYARSLPEEQRRAFTNPDPAAESKLSALKERIRQEHHDGNLKRPARENYRNPEVLGRAIRRDFTRLINTLFPVHQQPEPLAREAADHEAFAESRARVYIGRQEYFDRLDAHVTSCAPPLVVLGESGSGKSALLANWATRQCAAHPNDFVLMHFIGATPYSSDWAVMLRRIMGEFKRGFGIEQEIPEKPDALRSAFANWLYMAAAKGRVILILDALNQLEDRDGAPDLVWLPPVIPENVRLILSTLPGRPLDDLKKRGWKTLEIKPLEPNERQQLIKDYLAQYTKTLSPVFVERIASGKPTTNPLYLRALLEELRLYGDHFTLDQRINHYLTAATVGDLYEKILERYEQDYERDRPGLVRDAMSALWAARRGLSESELLELLGTNGQPLPRAHWSPLYLAAEHALVSRSGLLNFFHDYFPRAIENRYLCNSNSREEAHIWLAGYFRSHETGSRWLDELPWQFMKAKHWEELYKLLADPNFFVAAWIKNEYEVKEYWAHVEGNSRFRLTSAYRRVIEEPSQHLPLIWPVATLLTDTGCRDQAASLWEAAVDLYRRSGDLERLGPGLGFLGISYHKKGNLQRALALWQEQAQISRKLCDQNGLQTSLGNQVLILHARGEELAALALSRQQERICREIGNRGALASCFANQGLIFRARGDFESAMERHKEEEKICRELENQEGLQRTFGNQALILISQSDYERALALMKQQEQINRRLGNKFSLAASLANQAGCFQKLGDLGRAVAVCEESEVLCREVGYTEQLINSLFNHGVLIAKERPQEALAKVKESYQLAVTHKLELLAEEIKRRLDSMEASSTGATTTSLSQAAHVRPESRSLWKRILGRRSSPSQP